MPRHGDSNSSVRLNIVAAIRPLRIALEWRLWKRAGVAHRAAARLLWPYGVVLLATCLLLALQVQASPTVALPLRFHVVQENGEPVVSDAFLRERLDRANLIFQPYGVMFREISAPTALPAQHATITTRSERDVLGSHAERGAIHCFVVRTLIDVDEPPKPRRGVHWRSAIGRRARYVILSSIAEADVLAHELGHYLGNPSHSDVPGNLMSYMRGEGLPILDQAQLRRMRARIAKLRRGELRVVAPASTQQSP
jgi:hypothetical protein